MPAAHSSDEAPLPARRARPTLFERLIRQEQLPRNERHPLGEHPPRNERGSIREALSINERRPLCENPPRNEQRPIGEAPSRNEQRSLCEQLRRQAIRRLTLLAISLTALSAPLPTHADEQAHVNEPPLIAYSLELSSQPAPTDDIDSAARDLRGLLADMSRHPPPSDADCAHTLGAPRFAEQHIRLAYLRFTLGEFEAAIDANESALACAPRDAATHAEIASLLIGLGRIADARAALERGRAIDPDNASVTDVQPRISFLEERWADAKAQYRLAIATRPDTDIVEYDRLFYLLAQRRAGVREPEAAPGDDSNKHWPAPILRTLKGELTEAQLAEAIRADSSPENVRGWLTEALYYVGELRLAEGDTNTARKHFAAVVNLKVLNFIEYGLARAELARMRERQDREEATHQGP